MLAWQQIIFFNQLPSRFFAQLMSRLLILFHFWQRKSANILATSGGLHLCSSAFARSCSDITAFCCIVPLFRSHGHSYSFLFCINFSQNPSGS